MRLSRFAPLLAAAALAACAGEPAGGPEELVLPVFARGESHHFTAPASGAQEVPANDSRGRGNAVFWLSEDGTELRYRLIVTGLEGITQSHIHLAAEGVNGPVVVFLFGLVPAGVTQNGILAEGTITQANLIPRPAIGFGGTMAELVTRMRTGGAYVNVHTLAIPGGEVRGQIHENGPSK